MGGVRSLLAGPRRARAALLLGAAAVTTALGSSVAIAHPEHDETATNGALDTVREYDRVFKDTRQHGEESGHLPPTSQNVDLVGKLRISDARPGRISDVATLGNFAYLGGFGEMQTEAGFCGNGGVYVVDISNPRTPREVSFIPTTPGSYVGEGVQALRINTASFRGDILVHNNEGCAAALGGGGGMSIYDVTNPRSPRALVQHAGDRDFPPANPIHSVFAWQQGSKAYAVLVDDADAADIVEGTQAADVDIFDISNPANPVMIAEVGLDHWPGAQSSQSEGMGNFAASLHHDVQVRNVNGNWRMLVSYWDAGYILLDVNDPANPKFINDSEFPDPDPLTGARPPEGNAHYAEWDTGNRYILAADEDFDPFRQLGEIRSGPFSGEKFTAPEATGSPSINPVTGLTGPTYFVGDACTPALVPQAPSSNAIALVERGTCPFTQKAVNVAARGYQAGIVFNTREPESPSNASPCEGSVRMTAASPRPFLGVVPRSLGYKIMGIAGYNPADCPDPDNSQPALPALGTRGADIDISVKFDGWGYMRLLDANTLAEVDVFAVPEALDQRYASDFGDLSIHETAADPTRDLAYVAYYSAGFRVMAYGPSGLQEVGRFIDRGGNNLWGVEVHRSPTEDLVLASDRDSGLYIFRYTGTAGTRAGRRGSCVPFRRGIRGTRLGPATLGRTRTVQRRLFRGASLRSRRGIDRYCLEGGGALRIGYPTRRLNRSLGRALRRRVRNRAVVLLTTRAQYRLRGIGPGSSVRSLRRRLRGERRFRVGRNVWYVARARGSNLLFKTRGRRVLEVGIANKRLTHSGRGSKRFLRAWQL